MTDNGKSPLQIINEVKDFDYSEYRPILEIMYASSCSLIIIKQKMSGGYSGSLLLVIQPVTNDGKKILPDVAKITGANSIQEEFAAYQEIAHMWPNILPIVGPKTIPGESPMDGLRYRLGGVEIFEIENLRSYCQRVEINAIIEIFQQLFANMSQTLEQANPKHGTPLQAYYDSLLPVNLIIQPDQRTSTSVQNIQHIQLNEQTICDSNTLSRILPGKHVRLDGFIVTELDPEKSTVTLNLPRSVHKQLALSYRVRLDKVDTRNYRIRQVIPVLDGLIVKTRNDLLLAFAQKVIEEDDIPVDLSSNTIQIANNVSLQNPLCLLDEVLINTLTMKIALIHGDLNLENILIENYSDQNRRVVCIDVATARRDYVMHDFLRLEAEIITRILPPILEKTRLPVAQTIFSFYQQVYQKTVYDQSSSELPHPDLEKPFQMLIFIRENAIHYLSSVQKDAPGKWLEYHQGVMVYLLGALKLQSLEKEGKEHKQLPKRSAFWGAATIAQFLTNPPSKPVTKVSVTLPSQPVSRRVFKFKIVLIIGMIVVGLTLLGASLLLPPPPSLPTPTPTWTYTQEFESDSAPIPDSSKIIPREHASNQTVLGQFGCDKGVSTQANSFEYTVDYVPPTDHLYLQIAYSKNSPALADMFIYIDGAYCCKFRPTRPILDPPPPTPDSWDVFGTSKPMDLGPIELGGSHTIKFETKGQKYCTADLDYFTLSLSP